jgi:hypothetical protein
MSARKLPVRADLDQLRHQAKELLRQIRKGDPEAIGELERYHPERVEPSNAKLADAQVVLARSYEAPSWPRLVLACQLIDAIWRDDVDSVCKLVTKHPQLLHEEATIRNSHWGPPMTYAANLGRDRIIKKLHELGATDLMSALGRAILQSRIGTARMLHELAGRPCPPKGAVMGPAESLSGSGMALLLELGAEICDGQGDWRSPVAMILQTYCRNPAGKHQCLELIAKQGTELPDTPPMAVHRGRIDLLERHFHRDPGLLSRTFSLQEIYPSELGCLLQPGDPFHGTPLAGATLLHLCIDYGKIEIVNWLLGRGMDVNARAMVDANGFGGHTALFSCVVSYAYYVRSKYAVPKPDDDPFAQLLLDRGADPNPRTTLRTSIHDNVVHEYRYVTPLGWGQSFHAQELVCKPALRLIAERRGHS